MQIAITYMRALVIYQLTRRTTAHPLGSEDGRPLCTKLQPITKRPDHHQPDVQDAPREQPPLTPTFTPQRSLRRPRRQHR